MEERGTLRRLPLLALLIGVWAILPPYVDLFGKLAVKPTVEFVDHVVPGIVVISMAVLAHLQLRAINTSQLLLLVSGGVITLAGFWMLSTHIGLISQAREGVAPVGAVAWHGLPSIAVALLGAAWSARFWDTDEAQEPPPTQ